MMESIEKTAQKPKKRRSESEKVGRLKYIQELLIRNNRLLSSLDRRVSRIEKFRKRDLDFVRSDIEEICSDEVDREIVRLVFEAGDLGLLPSVVAEKLAVLKLSRFQVLRRIQRMNKVFRDRLDECLFEQRGWRWALSSFAVGAWGEKFEKTEAEAEVSVETEKEAWQ